jgi:hypothetical protein
VSTCLSEGQYAIICIKSGASACHVVASSSRVALALPARASQYSISLRRMARSF